MARERIHQQMADEQFKMDLMPMIDIVFQLIIFFMLVTEIKKEEIEAMVLPKLRAAQKDVDPPEYRVVVNVTFRIDKEGSSYSTRDGLIVRGKPFTQKTLEEYLRGYDQYVRREKSMGTADLSQVFVKIRADARVKWSKVQEAQMACTKALIYQVSYGSEKIY